MEKRLDQQEEEIKIIKRRIEGTEELIEEIRGLKKRWVVDEEIKGGRREEEEGRRKNGRKKQKEN